MIWVINNETSKKFELEAVWFPNKVINKWPATILAINRTAKVRGRITFLMDSINTIKGIRRLGVLWGTKWANMCLVLLIHPKNINLIHSGKLKVKVRVICLEAVKMYGNKPRKLLIKINTNSPINIIVLPLKEDGPKRVLNSLNSFVRIMLKIK